MRATYAKFFSESVLTKAMKLFGAAGSPKELEAAENFVFECQTKEGESVIIRLSSEIHKPKDQIEAEIEFVNYLSNSGAPVARIIPSIVNNFVEEIETKDSMFWAVAFEKANGTHPKRNELDTDLIRLWGKEIGKLNRLAKTFKPVKFKRQQWFEQDYYAKPEIYAQHDEQLLSAHKKYIGLIKNLRITADNFALIHTDVHTQNLLWDGTKMTIIDFDDCAYAHFAFDLAMAFWYGAHFDKKKSKSFWVELMDGYCSENSVSNDDLKTIPLFHLLRFSTIYLALSHELSSRGAPNEKQLESLKRLKDISISGILPFEMDYTM